MIRAEVEAALDDQNNDWEATGNSVLAEQTRLSNLVDDLLLLARMDEGGPPNRQEVDLDDLARAEAGRGWPLPVSTAEVHPVRMYGEVHQLSRAIQNLLANANRHATTEVSLSVHQLGKEAIVRVDDDGAGVRAAERDQIFDRFARLDEGRVRDRGGAGLGLAIVREVASTHGGQALVTNSPLGGARLELRLALSPSDHERRRARAAC
ncbi:MAG: signal transduction histidine kinase [Acidimicrobiales bacterium]